MVGQASSLSIKWDGQDACPTETRFGKMPIATKSCRWICR
jgi:hypothetical protein